ncbi:DUF72 domain-containing protein [bacterium]
MSNKAHFKIGTCSWKYDSWIGLIYSEEAKVNYLKAYAEHFSTVEIDQWFWSLYPNNIIKLPSIPVVKEYAESVPDDFLFSIKAPNSITLTHYYSQDKTKPLIENPIFFSNDILNEFLNRLALMGSKVGPIIFQFEYLNKMKMPNQQLFLEKLHVFLDAAPKDFQYAIEIRNPKYLNMEYFEFLKSHDVAHTFLEGYYMPPISEVYQKAKGQIKDYTVIRLHGPNRQEIEAMTQNKWNEIVASKDEELDAITGMIQDLIDRGVEPIVNVNNHFEGSAPKTIQRILSRFK